MKTNFAVFLVTVFFISACNANLNSSNAQPKENKAITSGENKTVETAVNQNKVLVNGNSSETANKRTENVANSPLPDCKTAKMANMAIDKKQTFAFDFEPFKNSCFVTFSDTEFTDYPLGEKFFIFTNGKQVFEFPNQSEAAGNHIEAVAFEDLNGDKLTDVIVASSVGEKSGVNHFGQVYVNNGKAFTTDEQANLQLDDLKSTKEIANFVRQHKQLFFK